MMSRKASDDAILKQIRALCETMRHASFPLVVVTNEVGWGVVPVSRLGRRFRDLAGLANQVVAQAADEVYVVVAGLPFRLKGVTHGINRDVVRTH
jgi:adenosylcobinamide kinase/adenosylcobinamide-phosphate guanylyltransferase